MSYTSSTEDECIVRTSKNLGVMESRVMLLLDYPSQDASTEDDSDYEPSITTEGGDDDSVGDDNKYYPKGGDWDDTEIPDAELELIDARHQRNEDTLEALQAYFGDAWDDEIEEHFANEMDSGMMNAEDGDEYHVEEMIGKFSDEEILKFGMCYQNTCAINYVYAKHNLPVWYIPRLGEWIPGNTDPDAKSEYGDDTGPWYNYSATIGDSLKTLDKIRNMGYIPSYLLFNESRK